jgi:hypothetical protein
MSAVHSLGSRGSITTSGLIPDTPTALAPRPNSPANETFGIAH